MFGSPPDVPGECNARLCLGDDHGDGVATIRCTLPKGHTGKHQERCRESEEAPDTRNVEVTWEGDERIQQAWWAWLGAIADDPNDRIDWSDMPDDFKWESVWRVMQEFDHQGRSASNDQRIQAILEAGCV